MFVNEKKKARACLLVIQSCFLLLNSRHTEVIGMPADIFLNPFFFKDAVGLMVKGVLGLS